MPPRREPYELAPGGKGEAKPLPSSYSFPKELESALHYTLMTVSPPPWVGDYAGGAYGGIEFALPMPKGLAYQDLHAYEDISMSSLTSSIGSALNGAIGAAAGGLSKAVGAGVVSYTGGDVTAPIAKYAKFGGVPLLTAMEVAYSTTPQRPFIFTFELTPRTPTESYDLWILIQALRYYAAPKAYEEAEAIWAWVAPWVFNIKFYYEGSENLYLPKIHQCALTRIVTDFDYFAGGKWAAFEETGAPVGVQLVLEFKEFEVSHKDKIVAGY